MVSATILLPPELLTPVFGHHVGLVEQARLAWLVSSVATVGGALGARLETDDAVRQAAHANRPEEPSRS